MTNKQIVCRQKPKKRDTRAESRDRDSAIAPDGGLGKENA